MMVFKRFFCIKNIVFFALLCCLFFLPLFEAPKNWFFGLFVIACLSLSKQYWNSTHLFVDWLILAWFLLVIISGGIAKWLYNLEFNFFDVFRFLALGWCVSKLLCLGAKQKRILIISTIVSTILAFLYAYFKCPEGGVCIELNSIGHVNHSAIFMLLVFSLALSMALFDKIQSKYLNGFYIFSAVFLGAAITMTYSRAAFLVMILIVFLMMGVKWIYMSRKQRVIVVSSILIICAITYYNPPGVISKIENGSSWVGESPRKKLRRLSYYVVKQYPWFGIGFGNFSKITLDDLKNTISHDMGTVDKNKFLILSHPHNLYYNYLVSGGVFLLGVLLIFFSYIGYIIYSFRCDEDKRWLVMASLSAMIVNLIIGLVNTTLHHEHAMLTMFIFGLLIAEYRRKYSENSA